MPLTTLYGNQTKTAVSSFREGRCSATHIPKTSRQARVFDKIIDAVGW